MVGDGVNDAPALAGSRGRMVRGLRLLRACSRYVTVYNCLVASGNSVAISLWHGWLRECRCWTIAWLGFLETVRPQSLSPQDCDAASCKCSLFSVACLLPHAAFLTIVDHALLCAIRRSR